MGVTYTAAIERDHRRATVFVRRFEAGHALFLATSVVCAIAIAMAYLGRVRTMPGSEAGVAPILLAPGQRAETLEPAFAEVFSSAQERRRAAREVGRFLQARLKAGRSKTWRRFSPCACPPGAAGGWPNWCPSWPSPIWRP